MKTSQIIKRTIMKQLSIESINRVQAFPADSQCDRKNIVLMPGNFKQYDPFLLMAEDWIGRTKGFEDHPHRGIETLTLVLEGEIEHGDNRGNVGVLRSGDVQWMTAGEGIIHREMPYKNGGHTLQLWINLPPNAKMTRARYQDLRAESLPLYQKDGVKIKVISGELNGLKAQTENVVPILSLEGWISSGSSTEIQIPADYNVFIYVIAGQGKFGASNREVNSGDVIWLTKSDETGLFSIEATGSEVHFFLAGGPPIGAPVVARGPFVMNTQQEIIQAYSDYQSGKFGGAVTNPR
jgi:redox-sensitive bicupin YhaK (pirin superfamily)